MITMYTARTSEIDEIDEAIEEILAASKAKSSFLSNMSHEIRTPPYYLNG